MLFQKQSKACGFNHTSKKSLLQLALCQLQWTLFNNGQIGWVTARKQQLLTMTGPQDDCSNRLSKFAKKWELLTTLWIWWRFRERRKPTDQDVVPRFAPNKIVKVVVTSIKWNNMNYVHIPVLYSTQKLKSHKPELKKHIVETVDVGGLARGNRESPVILHKSVWVFVADM